MTMKSLFTNVGRLDNMYANSITEISPDVAEKLCASTISDLPEYFGLPEANLQYAIGVKQCKNFAAMIDEKFVGLLSLDFPYSNNSRIYWMGILRKFHNLGIGKLLVSAASDYALKQGAQSMTVETLAPAISDVNYLNTYRFYEKCGFKSLFNLKPNGYEWEMVYMIKHLK